MRYFNKYRKLRCEGVAVRGSSVSYGKIGLKVLTSGKLTTKQVESARMVISRSCARKGKLTIRVNVFFPVTKKPLEVRMGGGKGGIDKMVSPVKEGAVIFELDNLPLDVAKNALEKAAYKLNIPCKVVYRKFAHFE